MKSSFASLSLSAVLLSALFAFGACETAGVTPARGGEGSSTAHQPLMAQLPGVSAVDDRAAIPFQSVTVPDALRYPHEIVLPWGEAEGAIGLRPPAEERRATGPSSLAIGPDGSLWVLDAVNSRLARLSPRGDWLESRPSPPQADDLAIGADDRLYVLSLMNRHVTVIDPDDSTEAVPISMAMRLVSGLHVDERGVVLLQTAYQETFDLGRPGAWTPWPDILHTKTEGIPGASGGPRLQVVLADRAAAIIVPNQGQGVGEYRPLPDTEGVASVALLDSTPNGAVTVLLERFQGDRVNRAVRWIDPRGDIVAERELHVLPTTFPFREFAVGPTGLLHQLVSQADGLHIVTFEQGGAR